MKISSCDLCGERRENYELLERMVDEQNVVACQVCVALKPKNEGLMEWLGTANKQTRRF